MENETVKRIKEVIERTRVFLQQDGGDVEYVDFIDGIVYVRLTGACVGCSAINVTLYDGIESILLAEVPEVIGIEHV
ncbi:MAG: NifU family protein [Candidatus Izimaplasma sp.]|nr:NifU family protein [Candidatus Izimaplasma bacterium]